MGRRSVRAVIIGIKHNIEVAHRLYETQGKCEQIHGHSMWVTVRFDARMGDKGMAVTDGGDDFTVGQELEFGALKRSVRAYLDETFDHRLLLNAADPFSGPIYMIQDPEVPLNASKLDQVFL